MINREYLLDDIKWKKIYNEEEYKYLESEDLIDELLYSIGLENKEMTFELEAKEVKNIIIYNNLKIIYLILMTF